VVNLLANRRIAVAFQVWQKRYRGVRITPLVVLGSKPADVTYRALLRLEAVGNLLLAAALTRLAERMLGLAMVLYALERFHSPQLAHLIHHMRPSP
jgi:hypothetical protein